MSRFDYRDPSTDSARCDALSTDHDREVPRQELCPNCKGNGVTWNHVEGGFLEKCQCLGCFGKGYTEEEL